MTPAFDRTTSPSAPGRRVMVTQDISKMLAAGGVMAQLLRRGWNLEPAQDNADDFAPVICHAGLSLDYKLRRDAKPVLTLGDSIVPGRLRMGLHFADSPQADDLHLARLVQTVGRTLDDDAIADALSVLAPAQGRRKPAFLPENATAGLRAATASLAATPPTATAHPGTAPALWTSLAEGDEIVCVGPSPLAGLGLVHHAATQADALQSLAAGPANHRDRTRRALATEVLFNSVAPDDAQALAALIDGGLRAIVAPPRRSVSIVITNYNYGRFLGAAIDSARAQTVAPHDIVVVDDGSTDGSAEMVASAPGITAIVQPNRGQGAAFNTGFARAGGDIVLFLDADDCLRPDAIARIGAADWTGISRLFFSLETIDRHGRRTGLYTPGTPTKPAAAGMLAGALAAHGIFPFLPTSGNAFPRAVLQRLLPMPERDWRICADLWLVLAAATLGEAKALPHVLGQYRVHGNNAHFDDLGAEPHARAALLKRRGVAWADLLARLPRGTPHAVVQTLRIGLHRCVTHGAAEAGRRHALRHVPQAARIALGARGVAPRVRLAHAMLPWRLALGRPSDFDSADAVNLVDLAGPSGWPRLVPGHRATLAGPSEVGDILGHGWAMPHSAGVRSTGAVATLAFRLPELPCHWRLRLGFAIDGEDPLRGVTVCLNGITIDKLDLHGEGDIDLRLSRALLVPWADVLGASPNGDGWPGPEPAACLTLHVAPADTGRLRLLSVRADVLTTTRAHAPCLPTGRLIWLAGGTADPDIASGLGSGWGWPDDTGVALRDGAGHLSFSLARADAHALTLVWDSMAQGRPADCLMVHLNGALVPLHPSRDGRQVTVVLQEDSAFAAGRVQIAVMAFADPASAAWPDLRLIALRLDPLSDSAVSSPRRARLAPNILAEAGPLVAGIDTATGLIADGARAQIVGGRFRLPLTLPPADGLARLEIALSAASPVTGIFALAGQRCEAVLLSDNVVSLRLPENMAGDLVLEGEVDDPAQRCVLRALRLVHPCLAGASLLPDVAGTDQLGPRDLFAMAEVRDDWHPPLDDALWLAAHRADLALPRLPSGTVALRITVLLIDGARQHLRIQCGTSAAETDGPGVQTLRIALDPADHAPRLTFICNRLIASQAVDAGDAGMLGAAILSITLEPSAQTEDRQHQHADAMPDAAQP